MTDNDSCYRSHAFKDALGEDVKHRWTPAPAAETARSSASPAASKRNGPTRMPTAHKPIASPTIRPGCIITTITDRHTGIGGLATPVQRLHNLTGKNS